MKTLQLWTVVLRLARWCITQAMKVWCGCMRPWWGAMFHIMVIHLSDVSSVVNVEVDGRTDQFNSYQSYRFRTMCHGLKQRVVTVVVDGEASCSMIVCSVHGGAVVGSVVHYANDESVMWLHARPWWGAMFHIMVINHRDVSSAVDGFKLTMEATSSIPARAKVLRPCVMAPECKLESLWWSSHVVGYDSLDSLLVFLR